MSSPHFKTTIRTPLFLLACLSMCAFTMSQAQFLDSFDADQIEHWFFATGDGDATMDFVQKDGFSEISVDATADKHNVWWTFIKRDISKYVDLELLKSPYHELRVEARIKVYEAPRRVNFMINTQRTTNYHKHLMEYDIDTTGQWHTISMTTRDLDAIPGDSLFVQLCVTDWGTGKHAVELDYYRADVVDVRKAGPDLGEPLPYHPTPSEPSAYTHQLKVSHDSLIHEDFPNVNFNNWQVQDKNVISNVLTISARQWAVLRWDFSAYRNSKVSGPGLLLLSTQSVAKGGYYNAAFGEDLGMEFGKVRIIEILDGEAEWDQKTVTWDNLLQGKPLDKVFNPQMVFDVELSEQPGSQTSITISRPVLQRLISGKTLGLVIKPLGAINASVYSTEELNGPCLYFDLEK